MATLSETDRARVWRGLMRYASRVWDNLPLSKADLLAAVNATDAWIDSNAASFNNALPAAAKANLSSAQKTLLFCAVALMRQGAGFLRAIFGEVN